VDVVCRYGGDEFAVLLVETGVDGAHLIAERIRDSLRARRFLAGQGLDVRLTASLGVATFPEHGTDALGLLRAADQAMYAAKARGRDDVCLAEPLPTPHAAGG
jgi:diguanylate cyclase (GGDEF)-like protein